MKKFKKRYLFYLLVFAFSLFVSFLPKIYEIIEPYRLMTLLEKRLSKVVGKDVYILRLSVKYRGLLYIDAKRIVVIDKDRKIVARADEMQFQVALGKLLEGKFEIKEVKIKGSALRIFKEKKAIAEAPRIAQEKRKEIRDFLNRIQAKRIIVSDFWLMYCEDDSRPYVDECISANVEESDFSLMGDKLKINKVDAELILPWYQGRFRVSGKGETSLASEKPYLTANIGATIPSLMLRERWREKIGVFPETEGTAEISINGKLEAKTFVGKAGAKSDKLLVHRGAEKIDVSGLNFSFEGSLGEKSQKANIRIESKSLSLTRGDASLSSVNSIFNVYGTWDGKKADGSVVAAAGAMTVHTKDVNISAAALKFDVNAQWSGKIEKAVFAAQMNIVNAENAASESMIQNIGIKTNGTYDGKKLDGKIETSSNIFTLKLKKNKFVVPELKLLSDVSLYERKLRFRGAKISVGSPAWKTEGEINAEFLFEKPNSNQAVEAEPPEYGIGEIQAAGKITSSNIGIFGIIGKIKGWPINGPLISEFKISGKQKQLDGNIKFTSPGLQIDIPKLYGKNGAPLKNVSGSVTAKFINNTDLIVETASLKFADTDVTANGKAVFKRSSIREATANITSSKAYYRDIGLLLPSMRIKENSRAFFFGDFKSASVKNATGKLRWLNSWRKTKRFVSEGIEANGEVVEALIDLGGCAIKVKNAGASMKNGNLFFDKVVGNACGSDLSNAKVEITSLGANTRLIVYLDEKIKAESVVSLLTADRINAGVIFEDVSAHGAISPSLTIEIPLKKGDRSHVIRGKAVVDGAMNFSVAGVLPFMERMSGEILFSGRSIKIPKMDFRIGKMQIQASMIMNDFLLPVTEVRASSPKLLPDEFFAKIPPRASGAAAPSRTQGAAAGPKTSSAPQKRIKSKKDIRRRFDDNVAVYLFLEAPKGHFKTLEFTELKSEMMIRRDFTRIRKLRMDFAGGVFKTVESAVINYAGPYMEFEFMAKNMDPYDFMKIFGVKNEVIRGNLTLYGGLNFTGSSTEAIVSNLNGDLVLQIKDGQIEQSSVLFSAFNLLNIDFSKWQARRLGYRSIDGQLHIKKGIMKLDNVIVNGFFLTVVTAGQINLRKMDLEVDIGLVPLGSIEKAIGGVPIVGDFFRSRTGKTILGYYFRVKGPLNDYRVVQLGPEGGKEQVRRLLRQMVIEAEAPVEEK